MPNTDRAQIAALSATPFLSAARAQTMLRDFDRLRTAIRSGDIEGAERALDKCERWFGCIDPRKVGA